MTTTPNNVCTRNGIALLAVVVVVALMATAALTFALLMQQSNRTARNFADQQQSQWALESAVATLQGLAALPHDRRNLMAGDNASAFVQSLEVQPAAIDGSGGLESLNTLENDWTSTYAEGGQEFAADWQTAVNENQIEFDPAQPGFVIFDWGQGEGAQGNAGAALLNDGGAFSTAATPSFGNSSVSNTQNLTLRFGWTNESSKLHLAKLLEWEAAGAPASLPLQIWCGLDPQQADQLLDWIDRDDTLRPFGAEAKEYSQRGLSYRPLNQVPTTLDALLLVPGISPRRLFGQRKFTSIQIEELSSEVNAGSGASAGLADFSRSQQDQIERDLQALGPSLDTADRGLMLEFGLASRLTVTAQQRHVNLSGQPQLPVNHANLQQLFTAASSRLDPTLATYLCLVRQYGVQAGMITNFSSGSFELGLNEVEIDFSREPTTNLDSLVPLIDSHVSIPQADGTLLIVNSPLSVIGLDADFPAQVAALFDEVTTSSKTVSVGKIHWRLADPQLLLLIPGLTDPTRQLLVGSETDMNSSAAETPHHQRLAYQAAAWYQENQLTNSQWQILERELTDGGDVFSAYIFAHAGEYRAIRWAHAIIDASGKRAQQVYYREMMPPPPTLQAVLATLNENAFATP